MLGQAANEVSHTSPLVLQGLEGLPIRPGEGVSAAGKKYSLAQKAGWQPDITLKSASNILKTIGGHTTLSGPEIRGRFWHFVLRMSGLPEPDKAAE